jgi:hypothetical protein
MVKPEQKPDYKMNLTSSNKHIYSAKKTRWSNKPNLRFCMNGSLNQRVIIFYFNRLVNRAD